VLTRRNGLQKEEKLVEMGSIARKNSGASFVLLFLVERSILIAQDCRRLLLHLGFFYANGMITSF
jgi:hypothetical protein